MDIVKENKKMVSVHYDSVLDILNGHYTGKNKRTGEQYERFKTYNQMGSGWFGPTCRTAKEIIDKGLLGDTELYEKYLKPKMVQLGKQEDVSDSEQMISVVKRKRIHSSQGDEIDIHKVYQGQMDTAWSKMVRIEVAQKFHLVTLFINYGGNASESATDSLWRAAVAVRLATELESAGKSVQIVVGTRSSGCVEDGTGREITDSITIKRFNQKLSMERLAALSHTGAFRVFGFVARCSIDYPVSEGLGVTQNINDKEMPIHLQEEVDSGHTKFVHIGRADSLHSAQNALKHCYNQMKEFSN